MALALICLLIGFALGENKIIQVRQDTGSLSTALEHERAKAIDLEAKLIDAELVGAVHKNAGDELRVEMQSLRRQIAELGEEVTFYKSLMAPGEVQQGLQVDGLEINITATDDVFSFELLLTQIALRRTYIAGEVRVDVVGQEDKTQVVKSLTDLGFEAAYPLKFRFRYFQDLAGSFQLPEGFVPEKVLVTAKQNGKDELQVGFPWISE